MNDMSKYFSGRQLYGNDLDLSAIEQWYQDEEEAYYRLAERTEITGAYEYHALNAWYGFSRLKGMRFGTCLAIGCADGEDVRPLAPQVDRFIALEPAEEWWSDNIDGKPAQFLKPAIDGTIPLPASSVDLVTSFGVLHHIPNVRYVLGEIARVLSPGGVFLLREPIFSMGDWTKPRDGLTAHERGIPIKLLQEFVGDAGLKIETASLCMVPTTYKLSPFFGIKNAFSSRALVVFDRLCSLLLSWNLRYHRTSTFQKLAPTSCFIVSKKA